MDTIAWAAGLFEGEGSISAFGTRKHQRSITLAMTDEDVILRFAAVMKIGKVYGPYAHKVGTSRENYKQYWRWTVADKDGVTIAAQMLLPFMGQRRSAKLKEAIEAVSLLQESTRARSKHK